MQSTPGEGTATPAPSQSRLLARPFVRAARPGDAALLAASLRPADRRELAALGRAPLEALEEAISLSVEPLAAVTGDGRLIALFGAAPSRDAPGGGCACALGTPWMLASPALEEVPRAFLRECRGWLDHIGRPFALLANCVDERNAVHIRWLRWCGFSFLRRLPLGPEARPFLEFVRLRPETRAFPPDPRRRQRRQTMCDFTALSLAFGVLNSVGGAIQQQQRYKAQQREAEQRRALLRRQAINTYDEIALERQERRAADARHLEEGRRDALRARETIRTRAGEAGSAGLSLQGLLRDLGGREAQFAEGVRDANRFSNQRLEARAKGQELQTSLSLGGVRDPARPNFLGAAQDTFASLGRLQNRLA